MIGQLKLTADMPEQRRDKLKAKDLMSLLEEYPDFNIQISLFEPDGSTGWGAGLRTFKVIGIGDIGHSDKILQLDIDDRREGREITEEKDKELRNVKLSLEFYKTRVQELLRIKDKFPEPYLTMVCRIIANGRAYLGKHDTDMVNELRSAIHGSGDCILYIDGHVNKEGFILDYRQETGCDPRIDEVIHGYVTYKNGLSYFTEHMENSITSEPVTYCNIN
jgi:hypothetical protein